MTDIGFRGKNGGESRVPVVGTVVIVGVGLMGGSLGLALIEQNAAQEVVGVDSAGILDAALAAGAIQRACSGLDDAVKTADLVVLATPIHTIPQLLQQVSPLVSEHTIVTDLASVKTAIVDVGERLLGARFIGGHPMAGSEQTGIQSARSGLYSGAAWAITPADRAQYASPGVETLCKMVRAIGAAPIVLDPGEHDRAAALISHLPHFICYAYNRTVDSSPDASNALALAAGSYRDLTRVAASDPVLWRDVFIENRVFLLETLRAYQASLADLENAINSCHPDDVLNAIMRAARR